MADEGDPVGYERVYYTNSQGERAWRLQRVPGNLDGLLTHDQYMEYAGYSRDSDVTRIPAKPSRTRRERFERFAVFAFVAWLTVAIVVAAR